MVTRDQLLEAGVTPAEIKHRLRSGGLLPVHRGVFRAGHRAPSMEATYLAAVRACGPRALLSGRAAGHLLGLLKSPPPYPEVTAPTERRVAGVRTRRWRTTNPPPATTWLGIPVTTVPATLVDLAGELTPAELARACHEAVVRHRITPVDVETVLDRRPSSRGAASLKRVLRGDERVTLSALERRFLERMRQAGLPLPLTNRKADAHWVDCRWSAHRLTVELDSYRFHSSRHAWENDRRRERHARARGEEFRRYTHGDVLDAPALMLAELQALLSHPPDQGSQDDHKSGELG